jgi:hypothetical protein
MIEGGQIPDPPPGFALDPNCSSARLVFRGAEAVRQRCYFTRGEPHNSIVITEFKGTTSESAVGAAKDDLASRYKESLGPIESLRIDGRPAWGWLETQMSGGKLYSLKYQAVVAYPASHYSVEFFATDPRFRSEEFLRRTVTTFAVLHGGQIEWKGALVVLIAAAGLVLAYRKIKAAELRPPPPPRPTRYQGPPLSGRQKD